ncbi:MAG: RHS repeat domain-containing protein, partial [Thermoplasmata archaeon]
MSEAYQSGGSTTFRDYVNADGELVAVRTTQGSSIAYDLVVDDHLGSAAVVTDGSGNVLQRLSYDPWGARRNPDGTVPTQPITGIVTRGFTGQEMIDEVGLINFNARLYDPQLGRFLSADPTMPNEYLDQLLDRYIYVADNPLSLTDPTGLCFLSCDPVFHIVVAIFAAIAVPEFLAAIEAPLILGESALEATTITLVNIGITGGVEGYLATGSW